MNKKFLFRSLLNSLLIILILAAFIPASGASAAGTAVIRSTRFSLSSWDKNLYLDLNATCDYGAQVYTWTPDYKYSNVHLYTSRLNGNWRVLLYDLKPRTNYELEIYCVGNPDDGHLLYWDYNVYFSGGTINVVRTSIREQGKLY